MQALFIGMGLTYMTVLFVVSVLLVLGSTANGNSCTSNFLSRSKITSLIASSDSAVSGQQGTGTSEASGGEASGSSGAGGRKKKKKKQLDNLVTTEKQQSLFIHLTFNCTGRITAWIFAAEWKGDGGNRNAFPQLQVWRNSAGTTYNKIHSTTVNVVSQSNDNGIYEYSLTNPINVTNGDVLSVFQPKKKNSRIMLYFQGEGDLYYCNKQDESIDQIDINDNENLKNGWGKPLITAVISQVSITSTLMISTTPSVLLSTVSIITSNTPHHPAATTTIIVSIPSPILTSITRHAKSSLPLTSLPYSANLFTHPPTVTSSPSVKITQSKASLPATTMATTDAIHRASIDKATMTSVDQTLVLCPSNTLSTQDNSQMQQQVITNSRTSCTTGTDDHQITRTSTTIPYSSNTLVTASCNGTTDSCAAGGISLDALGSIGDDKTLGISSVVIIVLVIVFACIFTLGMSTITICILCVFVFVIKKRKDENELEMISCPSGSRPNRYLQKSATSPMYEGIVSTLRTVAAQQQQELDMEPHSSHQDEPRPSHQDELHPNHKDELRPNHHRSSDSILPPPPRPPPIAASVHKPMLPPQAAGNRTSVLTPMDGSSCPSATVQPDIIVNIKQPYDHLLIREATNKERIRPISKPVSLPKKATTINEGSSLVSPYEKPILPDEMQPDSNIPIGFYDFADDIYVPTEHQRSKVNDVQGPDHESLLYKSLYEAQHETVSSDEEDQEEERGDKKPEFFKETQEYWKPSFTKQAIYQQLANKRFREIPRHKIQVVTYLGSGQFATVNKAVWKMAGGDVEVAVKMIKEGAPEEERIKFLREAAINGQFHHLNVVRLLGVVTVGEPTMIVLELLRNGNLKKYLTSKRPSKSDSVVPPELLLNFSKQVSSGMEYLAKKTFVHRDVAARNILVSDQLICKVADFGMSRDLEESNYYVSQGGLVPIKWTAPEALYYRKYSTASDVWSYGVLLFEIWSFGKKPYSTLTNEQYIDDVDEGKRLAPPPGCPRPIYQMMIECWHPEPNDRPTFTDLYQQFADSASLLSLGVTDDELVESSQCDKLGAPLECGSTLFMDLQLKYYNDM